MSNKILISLSTCRKIFIERDYSNGLVVKFDTNFPMPLEGIVWVFFFFLILLIVSELI